MPTNPSELDFVIDQLVNSTGSAEGRSLPPQQKGEFRVPFVTSFRLLKTSSYLGVTVFTLAWEEPVGADIGVSHYNIYVTGADGNKAPMGPFSVHRSPVAIHVPSSSISRVTFFIQTQLTNGLVSDLERSPATTGITGPATLTTADYGDDTITIAKLADGTPGQIISWDNTGEAVVFGAGATDEILVGTGAATPTFKSRATLDLVQGRSTLTAIGQIVLGTATAGTVGVIAAGAADSILVGSGAGVNPQFKTRTQLDLVEGRANLADATRVVIVSSAGVVTQTAYAHTDLVQGAASLTDAGAVPYVASAGVLTDAPTTFFWNNALKKLLIGTDTSTIAFSGLELYAGAADAPILRFVSEGGVNSGLVHALQSRGGGTPATQSGDQLFAFFGFGHDGAAYTATGKVGFNMLASENWTAANQGTQFTFQTTENTTTTRTARMRVANTGKVRIHGSAEADPSARLEVQETTVGNEVLRLTSEATNDDPTERVYQNRVATTDATVTTIHTFTIPATTTYAIHAVVIARRTGGVAGTAEDGARYDLKAVYKNVAGTATLIGAITQIADEDQAAWNATFTLSGATVLCRVTGAADNNITWHVTAKVWSVGT